MSARDRGRSLAGGVLVASLVSWFLPGCPKPAVPVPVAGKVQEDGAEVAPVAQVVLGFYPQDDSNKNTSYKAATDFEGRFSLQCLPGKYKVTVAVLPKVMPKEVEKKIDKFKQKELDAKKLADPPKRPPGPNPDTKPPPELDPELMRYLNYRNPNSTPLLIDVPPEGKNDFFLKVKP